ncbi:hypothetical protein WM40_24680 [Robbsia andropogonis]|uniref:Uncharacterized protein n=1 Tax=Robbsia andropogonis TaxID=28092 RepID=A0A0F5JU52_9BURK|nr:hypothetical protein [Robbsia andropogonis]KKB61175.1 hypothetical protein WM40_24680 [Robbsia andropogonis]MCP1118665.1 hypothetical protein [Robbsia andropogonis]MCP1128132.1 hypothetical protein [Robbsia andropogonis]
MADRHNETDIGAQNIPAATCIPDQPEPVAVSVGLAVAFLAWLEPQSDCLKAENHYCHKKSYGDSTDCRVETQYPSEPHLARISSK